MHDRAEELEEELHALTDKHNDLVMEKEDLNAKVLRLARREHELLQCEAQWHFYQEKYEHTIAERNEFEARYNRMMKNNRILKEKKTQLKILVHSKGGKVSDSTSSSSSD